MKTTILLSLAAAGLLGLTACSSEAPAPAAKMETMEKKAPAGPAEPVSAKTAFYAMYTPARQWSADIQALSLVSADIAGVKSKDGKFGMWTAVFASPSLRSARTYTYAVAEQMPIPKGVKAEGTEAWAGPTTKAMTFDNSDFKIDSDAAYTTAMEKAGAWVKEHADAPVVFTLGAAKQFNGPVWYIMWGDAKSGYASFVNATTGKVVK